MASAASWRKRAVTPAPTLEQGTLRFAASWDWYTGSPQCASRRGPPFPSFLPARDVALRLPLRKPHRQVRRARRAAWRRARRTSCRRPKSPLGRRRHRSVRTDHSLGTGFAVGPSLIATNLHVISGSSKITVTLTDKRELPVLQIENGDRERDLVLLRVEASRLPSLTLGDSSIMRPGDPVVAIGHPMGLEDTVSNGLVSAVRHIDHAEKELTVLQISAPIAPGSSGARSSTSEERSSRSPPRSWWELRT